MSEDPANAVLGVIVDKVITRVVDSIGRQFGYIFCYKSKIKTLAAECGELENSIKDAQRFFEAQKRDNKETTQSSTGWLKNAEVEAKAAKEVQERTDKLYGWCPNLKERYVLGRKSMKVAEDIRKLQARAPKVTTTNPAPPAGMLTGSSRNDGSMGYKTRMETLGTIMKALAKPGTSVIGICGLAGVGKTTMVNEVRKMAIAQNMFHDVCMSTVSKDPDLFKIQGDIAEMLGLNCLKEENNVIARADQLYKRLTNGTKVLVILDDVWKNIKLKDIGIPDGSDHTECKVIITSREERRCTNIQEHIQVKVLTKEEARVMFRKTAGDCIKTDNLEEIADELADECGCLPIAVLTLAGAVSGKERRAWEDACQQLKNGNVTSIPGMGKGVYECVKLSYDYLAIENLEEAQSLLLLCCQHPEDAEIKVEKLAQYWLALELSDGDRKFVYARNRVYSLIEHLKRCFLLQEVENRDWKEEAVKMHDVIRDVCSSIISSRKEEGDKVYMNIMARERDQLDTRVVDYPKLKLLMHEYVEDLNISIFQQMRELRVFETIRHFQPYPSPPLQVLTNLRMLSIQTMFLTEDFISTVRSLTMLEILILLNCNGSLPRQIGLLTNLKILDLRCHDNFACPMPSGILPGLNKLEVLCMGNYVFVTVDSGNSEYYGIIGESYARVSELDSLPNLTTLQICLEDPIELLHLQHFCFGQLERFCFGPPSRFTVFRRYHHGMLSLHEKSLELERVGMEWVFGAKIQFIVRSTLTLDLRQIEWTDPLLIRKFVSLRELNITLWNRLEYLIYDGDGVDDGAHSDGGGSSGSNVFMNLEILRIEGMDNMRELCRNGNLPSGSLHKLQVLYIQNLSKLRQLWEGPTDPLCLINLKDVEISACPAIESIFPHSAAKCLVQLQILNVSFCEMLIGIVSNAKSTTTPVEINKDSNDAVLHFPKLRQVVLQHLCKFRGFYNLDDDGGRAQPLLNPLVIIPRMEDLDVNGLHQLQQIVGGPMFEFPTFSTSDWLQNLRVLSVESCDSLESVFDFRAHQVLGESAHAVTLGKLHEITLSSLQNLSRIFHCRMQDISVPELQRIIVCDCDNLANVAASNLIKLLGNLKAVVLEKCESIKAVFDFEGLEVMRDHACSILSELEHIDLGYLPNLEHICRLVPEDVHVFQNLKTLKVIDCGSLGYLIPSSIAHMLGNLQELIVERCRGMKEVLKMNEDCGEKKIAFRSLRSVLLDDLENLSSFCSGELVEFEFALLERVSITKCPEMKTFCCQRLRVDECEMLEGFVSEGEGTTTSGGETRKVKLAAHINFPKLSEVQLSCLPKLQGFYNLDDADDGRVQPLFNPLVTLPSMKRLLVYGCHQLKQIVRSKLAAIDLLQNLDEVIVHQDDSLETVFDFEVQEVTGENAHAVTLGELREIELNNLPSLTHIIRCRMQDNSVSEPGGELPLVKCESVNAMFDSEGLEASREDASTLPGDVEVLSLEHVCRLVPQEILVFQNLRILKLNDCGSLSYIIPMSISHMLGNLLYLIVKNCKSIKEVVKMSEDCGGRKRIVFRSLISVMVGHLEKLSSFCSSDQVEFEFPSLKSLSIDHCPELKTFCCQTKRANFRMFDGIVTKGEGRSTIGGDIKEEPNNSAVQFPGLESGGRVQPFYDQQLVMLPSTEDLYIDGLHQLRHIVGSEILHVLKFTASVPLQSVQLKDISVLNCDSLVNIAASNFIRLLQNLQRVCLMDCESVKTVFDFEGLEAMREDACSILAMLEYISVSRLAKLEHVFRLVPKQIHAFQKLTTLTVDGCGSLGYLISSYVAHMLVNLQYLIIKGCTSMKEVIKRNEDCVEKKIVFLSLFSVRLESLENLLSFCSCDRLEFEFPSLERVVIVKCPKMKSFCCGHLTAEKLHGVYFVNPYSTHNYDSSHLSCHLSDDDDDDDDDPIPVWKSDLNETIRHFNARVNHGDLKDGVGNNDAEDDDDDIHVPGNGVCEYAQSDNEGTSPRLTKASGASLIISSLDASLDPLVISSSSAVIDGNKYLACSSSSPDLGKAASPPCIVLSDFLVQSKSFFDSPGQLEKLLTSGHEGDPQQELVISAPVTSSLVAKQPDSVQNMTDWKLDKLNESEKIIPEAIEVERADLNEGVQKESGHTSELDHHTAGLAVKADVSDALATWEGHAVTRGEKDLLEAVKKHFPNTFHGVNFHSEVIWKVALDTFCCCLLKFLVANVYELSSKEVAELRALLLDLETFKFKVNWALDRLEKVEKLRFGSPFPREVADINRHRAPLLAKVELLEADLALAKEELGNLDVLRETKVKALFNEFGDDGLYLLEGSLGRGLLPSYQSG